MLLIFLLPLAAAALHLAFAQPMVWQILQLFGIQNLTLFLGVTGAARGGGNLQVPCGASRLVP